MPDSTPPEPPAVLGRADIRRKARRRVAKRLQKVGIVVAAVLVVLVGSGIAYVEYRNHQISHLSLIHI